MNDVFGLAFDACVTLLVTLAALLDPVWPGGMDYVKINVLVFCVILPIVLVAGLAIIVWQARRIRQLKHKNIMIIGLIGKKSAGKELAATFIAQEFSAQPGKEFSVTAFADPIRRVCEIIFGLTYDEMTSPELKDNVLDRYPYLSPRDIIRQVGTDAIRNVGGLKDAWVQYMERTLDPKKSYVIHDVRFLNEQQLIKDLGGYIIRIKHPETEGDVRDLHSTEKVMDTLKEDVAIENTGHPQLFRHRLLATVYDLMENPPEAPKHEIPLGEPNERDL